MVWPRPIQPNQKYGETDPGKKKNKDSGRGEGIPSHSLTLRVNSPYARPPRAEVCWPRVEEGGVGKKRTRETRGKKGMQLVPWFGAFPSSSKGRFRLYLLFVLLRKIAGRIPTHLRLKLVAQRMIKKEKRLKRWEFYLIE